jgi:signal transduction histidine kinase
MMGYSEPNQTIQSQDEARLAEITDAAELSDHFRKFDVEKDIWQLVAADMDLEDSLFRITDALHRHEPKVRTLILLANKSNNSFAFAQSARLNDSLAEVFTGIANGESWEGGTCLGDWTAQLASSRDIARDERWADPWRRLFTVAGIQACYSVPILDPERLQTGCVMMCFSQPRDADEFEAHIAQCVSSAVSVFVAREQSARELRTRVEQIERLAVAGRLSASIAHEINNPLEAVTNLLFLLSNEPSLSPAANSYLSTAQSELQRISEITTQTLHFYRKRYVTEECAVADIIRGLLILYRGRLQHARISIRFDEEPTELILCHPGELRQVFANLLTNAVDALGNKNGTIWIRIRPGTVWKRSAPGVRVTIADNGPGMNLRFEQRSIKHFSQPNRSTELDWGFG